MLSERFLEGPESYMISKLQHGRKLSAREGGKVGWLGSWISFLQTNEGANNLSGSFKEDEVHDVSLA